jgi:hypothetical protein
MMPESPVEEVLLVDRPATAQARPIAVMPPARIASLTLGILALSLAVTAVARRATGRQRTRERRRGALVTIQPRVGVFAPNLTIALPFSAIAGQEPRGRRLIRARTFQRARARRGRRPARGRPAWLRRSASRGMR